MSEKEIKEYDGKGNLIHFKYSNGYEYWQEFDENNKIIHLKCSNGYEFWYKWDGMEQIVITEQEFKQIERRKIIFNNKKINRFELMDI